MKLWKAQFSEDMTINIKHDNVARRYRLQGQQPILERRQNPFPPFLWTMTYPKFLLQDQTLEYIPSLCSGKDT